MKTQSIQYFLIPIFLLLLSPIVRAQESSKSLFNDNWQFIKGDHSFNDITDSNITWNQVNVPHDWSINEEFNPDLASGTGFLPGGIGWYKKEFELENFSKEKKYAIYFDGIYKNSEVWINGEYLGKHPNGFIPFQYDLTPYLKENNNIILVKANHSDFADSRYYTGSGIYRNVYLKEQNKIHFSQWGVFFSTPEISQNKAIGKVEIELENHSEDDAKLSIEAVLRNEKDSIINQTRSALVARPQRENYLDLALEIDNPNLWSPETPNLYHLEVSIKEGDKTLETWTENVGIRSFEFTANEGFFLNGKNTLIKGVCIHHDAGALGAAVPEAVWRKRLETLKELGANAIRMSHYPHQDYLYDLADELGFLVQDEAFDEWEYHKNKWIEGWNVGTPGNEGLYNDFQKWAVKDLQAMVRRSRNHPSIFMWSIGNEIDYPNDPYSHPVLDEGRNPQIYGKGYQEDNPPVSHLAKLSNELVHAVKMYDKTRPVTAALAGVTMSNETNYPSNLDIVGYNYQEYRYKEDHEKYPERVIYGSENGDALNAWLAVKENDYISSQFLWTAFDFIGEAREWPSRSSGAGIIDLAGKPKPDFYFRKSLWNNEPMAYIGVTDSEKNVHRRTNIEESWTGDDGETKWVTAYANTDEVELFLNGESLGKKEVAYKNDKMIAWEIPFEKGELLIKAYNKNEKVAEHQLTTPGSVAELHIEKSKKAVYKEGDKEIIHVDILLTDDTGNRIVNDDREVSITIDGPAVLLGLESGDLSSHENYQAKKRKTYKGQLRGYIQTSGEKGDIKISINSPGLSEKVVTY